MGEQLRSRLDRLGEAVFQGFADLPVKFVALAAQQAAVGGLLDQGVLELVDDIGRCAAAIDQLGLDQLVQGILERHLVERGHGGQQLVAEHAAERRGQMRDVLDAGEAIEARHQRVVQGFGNRQQRQRTGQTEPVSRGLESAQLEHRLGELLDIEGHAVGPGDDMVEDLGRQLPAAGHLLDQRRRLAVAEMGEGERGDVRKTRPGRHETGPVGDQQQDRHALNAIDHQMEQLARRGVDPVCVLEQDQQGARGEALQLLEQSLEGQRLLAFGRDVERWIALASRDREQRRQQGRRAGDLGGAATEQRLQLVQFDLWRVALLEIRRPLQLVEHGMQGAVNVEGRAIVAQHRDLLAPHEIPESLDDARFADTRLAGQQDHLAFAGFGVLPARKQQADLLVASDQRRETPNGGRLEAAGRSGRFANPKDGDRLVDSSDRMRTEFLEHEQTLGQPTGPLADHDGSGLGHRLQPRRHIGRLADDCHRIAKLAGADVADHHHAGVDADPNADADPEVGQLVVQSPDRLDDLETGPDRALGIVLVRFRIAEVNEDTVADVVADMAFETRDDFGAAFLITTHDFVQIFGIEPRRERGRADHVAKHHRELPPFSAVAGASGLGRRPRLARRRRWSWKPWRPALPPSAPRSRASSACDRQATSRAGADPAR